MNMWLKAGIPILVGILLVISMVSITAVTNGEAKTKAVALSDGTFDQCPGNAKCLNCPVYGEGDSDDAQVCTCTQPCIPRGNWGSCWKTSQGNSNAQIYRGACCGAR